MSEWGSLFKEHFDFPMYMFSEIHFPIIGLFGLLASWRLIGKSENEAEPAW